MIGGGGHYCQQADHGIAITEAENASFLEKRQGENDLGNDRDIGTTNNKTYSLNLWIYIGYASLNVLFYYHLSFSVD